STVTEPMWKNFRIALRAGGTASAIPSASAPTTRANTAGRTQRLRCSRSAIRGHASRDCGNSSSLPTATSARSSSVIRLPQPLERTRGARLDRSLRDAERLGDLGFGQAEEVAQRDDVALLVRQAFDGREQRRALL